MSDVYFQVPPTSGKIVLITSHGELDIELWCTETPRACRNFIQLCLEGYYDQTIFHRLVPGFMIQGGDPTGTGKGGESIYGRNFLDEFHQRLKFVHRGMVAMANGGPNDNGSQFFITFDACSWLDKKHTIFGRVVGDTVYNLMNMQNLDTDKQDRPLNPPKIISTKVLINPFDDIFVRHETRKQQEEEEKKKKQKEEESKNKKTTASGKRKAKNINLLSFADDEDAQDIVADKPTEEAAKIVSSHDVLQDSKLSKQPVISQEELIQRSKEREESEAKKAALRSKIAGATEKASKEELKNEDYSNLSYEEQMRKALKHKKRQIAKDNPKAVDITQIEDPENLDLLGLKTYKNKKTGKLEFHWEGKQESGSESESSSDSESSEDEAIVDEQQKKIRQKQKDEYNNLKVELLQFKKDKLGTNNAELAETNKQEKRLLSQVELARAKYTQNKKIKRHEDEVLDKLNMFKKKLNSAQNKEIDESNWMSNKLKFHIDSARAYSHFENKEKASGFAVEKDTEPLELRSRAQEEDQESNVRVDVISVDDLLKMTE